MKRIILSFFIFALTMSPAYIDVKAQQPAPSNCTLTAANSPTIRDVKLGLSIQQVLALFPSASKRTEIKDALEKARGTTSNEVVYLPFDPITDNSGERFSGVESVLVGIYKGQVVDFTISYVGTTWQTVDEWIDKLSETFGLPKAKSWGFSPNENPSKILQCKGIEIEAGVRGGGSTVRVRNTEQIIDAGKESEERKRRQFKP
jgi:hypothetical protein